MMFLVRTAFWLGVVIMLIPVDDEARQTAETAAQPVAALEAVDAAQETLADVGGFCARNPETCAVGGRLATTFALKARTGAKLVSDFIDDQLAGGKAPADTARGTLTPADLAPEWRGPPTKAGNA